MPHPPSRPPLIINIPHYGNSGGGYGKGYGVSRVPPDLTVDPDAWGWVVRLLLLLSTGAVLFCGMFPFDFVFHFATAAAEISRRFDTTVNQLYTAGDGLENVVFFMPTGFAVAAWLIGLNAGWFDRIRWATVAKRLPFVILLGAILSTIVETSQVFLISRDPSLADIISNTTGSLVGAAVYMLVGGPIVDWLAQKRVLLQRTVTPQVRLSLALLWLLLAALLPVFRGDVAGLGEWNPHYPLIVGNEVTGDRTWNGTVNNLWIADQAIDDVGISQVLSGGDPTRITGVNWLSAYQFAGRGPYIDALRQGAGLKWIHGKRNETPSPDAAAKAERDDPVLAYLHSHTTQPTTAPVEAPPLLLAASATAALGAPTGDDWWLCSDDSAEAIVSEKISRSSAFTMVLDVHTDDLEQNSAPPRLISISGGTTQCNIQLCQEADGLIVRLRNDAAGEGGSDPECILPGVFTTTGPIRLVVTYGHGQLLVLSDHTGERGQFRYTAESDLVWLIYPRDGWKYRLDSNGEAACAEVYRILALVPAIFLLISAARFSAKKTGEAWWNQPVATAAAAILATLALDAAIAVEVRHLLPASLVIFNIAASGVLAFGACGGFANFVKLPILTRLWQSG